MTYITKPKVQHPGLPRNALGYTRRDYEGSMSTLCAGCGHDSVTASIIQAFFELDIEPHRVAKLSGIGCSAKTPTYFLGQSHGFNAVHGRMPSVTSGANAANRDLMFVGISGDGDSLSIGLGQFCHAIRRNVDMLYVLENNGVYGLTKGQFSASADVGSKSRKGAVNRHEPIDPVSLALSLGATFVARSFSGDREQLLPILKAGLMHKGFAFIDVISPCVNFNDHEGSTKSYLYTREHYHELAPVDFVPVVQEISTTSTEGSITSVSMHDGSLIHFRRVAEDYDPTDRIGAYEQYRRLSAEGNVVTGLLFLEDQAEDMHSHNGTVQGSLYNQPFEKLCPGDAALQELQNHFR